MFYTVLTLLDNDFAVITRCADFQKFIIIVEYGKSGINKHYNIIYQLKDGINQENWYKNSKKFWKFLYTQKQLDALPTQDYLIKTKKCTTPENVIGGYCIKEQGYKIIQNKGFDIELCKNIAQSNQQERDSKCSNLYEFIEKKILPFQNDMVPLTPDALASYAFQRLYKNQDLDALRFTKLYTKKQIRDILYSMMDLEICFFDF